MAERSLEQTLRDLPSVGTRVKDRGYRQVWRFDHGGKGFYLKFYRRSGLRDRARRAFRGSPAAREFYRLQWLQKGNVPAPRAVAFLTGFTIAVPGAEAVEGDAVILEAIEPSVPLDDYLSDLQLRAAAAPDHRGIVRQVIEIVHCLGAAGLGHDDLHLGNFLLRGGTVFLIDAYAVRRGGLKQRDVLQLGASVGRFATRTDLLRGWRRLGGGDRLPQRNPVAQKLWDEALQHVRGDNRYVGRIELPAVDLPTEASRGSSSSATEPAADAPPRPLPDGWTGVFFRKTKHARRWSALSGLEITADQWLAAWPPLLRQIEADSLPVLKRSRSGDVLAARLRLAGRDVDVIIKRPRRRYWYRYVNEIGRGSRARRAWFKAWGLIIRNIPTAWPVALFERRTLGYTTDNLFICERVPGPTLWSIDYDALAPLDRENLLRRTGRLLARIDRMGLSHFDAKASNWIVRADEITGPEPVLIDVDGIRRRRWEALGIRRLLRSLLEHRQYTPADSLALCRGYAPYAALRWEEGAPEDDPPADDDAEEGAEPDAEADPEDGADRSNSEASDDSHPRSSTARRTSPQTTGPRKPTPT